MRGVHGASVKKEPNPLAPFPRREGGRINVGNANDKVVSIPHTPKGFGGL